MGHKSNRKQRQAQIFISLMKNYGDVEGYVAEQTNSAGLAQDRYAIYLDNVEAAQNRMTASWEGLWQKSINSGAITWFYDLGKTILDAITKMGGLVPILGLVVAGFVAVQIATVNWSVALAALSLSNPALWIPLAIAGIAALIYSVKSSTKSFEELNAEVKGIDENISKLKDNSKVVTELFLKFKELSESEKSATEHSQEFYDVQNQIKNLLPEINGHFDEYGNFLLDATVSMTDLNDATKEQIDLQLQLKEAKANEAANAGADALVSAALEKSFADKDKYIGFLGAIRDATESEKIEVNLDWQKAIQDARKAFSEMSYEGKLEFIKSLEETGNYADGYVAQMAEDFKNELSAMSQSSFESWADGEKTLGVAIDETNSSLEETPSFIEEATAAYQSLGETMQNLTDTASSLQDIMANADTGKLNFSQLDELAKAYPDYLNALSIENGQLKLNTDMVREYITAKADQAVADAQAAGATANEIALLQAYADSLREQQYTLIGTAQVASGVANQIFMDIANQAALSGNSFIDLQGNALSSANAIYSFLQSGDAAFNSFVQQAANATGRSVQQVMGAINSMIANVYNNAASAINNLNGAITSGANYNPYASQSGAATVAPLFTPASTQYSGGSSGGGGGGGSSKEDKKAEKAKKAAEKQAKIDKEIEDARKDAIDDLKEQLSLYKDIVDARKEILDTLADERAYQQDIDEQNKNILDIQNQLAALQFDTSEEGQARTLELQDELVKAQKELENTQYENSINAQKDAIDAQYAAFESQLEGIIKQIEGLDVSSVSQFTTKLAEILSQLGTNLPQFHTGIDSGIVGGSSGSSKSNEVLAKVMKGELYVTPEQGDNFLKNILPSLASPTSNMNGGLEIGTLMEISVNGSLDRSVLPDINKIADKVIVKINEAMFSRGHNRRADLFATG